MKKYINIKYLELTYKFNDKKIENKTVDNISPIEKVSEKRASYK